MGSGSGTHRAYTPYAGAGSPEPLNGGRRERKRCDKRRAEILKAKG